MISDKLVEKECEALRKSIKKKQQYVNKAPEGHLQCHKASTYYNWYISSRVIECDDKKNEQSVKEVRKYIKKADRKLAEKMALKGLYVQELLDEKQELKSLTNYLNHRSHFERREKYLSRSDELRNLLKSHLEAKWSPDVQQWLDEHKYPDVQVLDPGKYRCKNGMLVRSKSEQLIVSALESHGVPFKYEEPLYLSNQLYFPDFTILNKRTGQEFIWEHFGMMNTPDYYTHNMKKINMYFNNGYIPFVNFITTFEVNNSGIDIMWIERIIETFFE